MQILNWILKWQPPVNLKSDFKMEKWIFHLGSNCFGSSGFFRNVCITKRFQFRLWKHKYEHFLLLVRCKMIFFS
jgi:hypothetical protein